MKKYRGRLKALLKDPAVRGDAGSMWQAVEKKLTTRGSWNTAKAAITFGLLEALTHERKSLQTWLDHDDRGPSTEQAGDVARRAVLRVHYYAKALHSMPMELPSKFGEPSAKGRPNSKSKSIRGVDPRWREAVAAQLREPLQVIYLIQSVCGCRSSELAEGKGVEVSLAVNGQLHFKVVGAKIGVHAGQPTRELTVNAQAGIAQVLAKRMRQIGPSLRSVELLAGMSADTYRKNVSNAAKRAFPERTGTKRLSAYSSRHQLKADLKASELSRQEIARAMGHSTERSASYYGKGGRGSAGGVKLVAATAARPVKQRSPYPGKPNSPGNVSKARKRQTPR
jgi:hypothetical protein